MPAHYQLRIGLDPSGRGADFRLLDAHGSQIDYHHTDIAALTASRQQGLFDLRQYLRDYIEEQRQEEEITAIGVCIAHDLLGEKITQLLWKPINQRTLSIQLPTGPQQAHPLAAALARVPWELTRPSANQQTLAERNLVVRIEPPSDAPCSEPLVLEADEPLRVLLVFAASRGSSPLAARSERRELLELFEREIYPGRRIIADVLSYGVTKERLIDQIQRHDGYHLIHWSGHGHQNLLELADADGHPDPISGEELVELFADAGGFLPRLVFLSACHSGAPLIRSWSSFLAVAQGVEPTGTKVATAEQSTPSFGTTAPGDPSRSEPAGFTGTAAALLAAGVPTVVAMRFAVGDGYARQLAVAFYRHLLADQAPKEAATALAMARRQLINHPPGGASCAWADHATPLLYGQLDSCLPIRQLSGRSPARGETRRRLHSIPELTAASHDSFVGRTWELAGLGARFLGSTGGAEVTPVAVITGLGGMGKSALLSEALDLWESRFQWLLLYQAKPSALSFEGTLRDIHLRLAGEEQRYYTHVQQHRADAIHREASETFTGPKRLQRLMENLCRALRDEPILLVLDNFETNLLPQPDNADGAEPLWRCQDPAWDQCLQLLAKQLQGSSSRVLITSRRPLAAQAGGRGYGVPLGPLQRAEAALYLGSQPTLRAMAFGEDLKERQLALRLLSVSRFHPLLMTRLARLAAAPDRRSQLLEALDTLERQKDFAALPELFTGTAAEQNRELEQSYLRDALTTSTDQLIAQAGAGARQLLWILALANDPVSLRLLEGLWSTESHEVQRMRFVRKLLDLRDTLPPEQQRKLDQMPREDHEALQALPKAPQRPALQPLLSALMAAGLLQERQVPTGKKPEQAVTFYSVHALVVERIDAWMEHHPAEQGDRDAAAVRRDYAEHLMACYEDLLHQQGSTAQEAGRQAIVYFVQAGAYDQLGGVAGQVVTSIKDPVLLQGLLPHLHWAVDTAPAGRPRMTCLILLADALHNSGAPRQSLPFYEQAADLARLAIADSVEEDREGWMVLAVTYANWGCALRNLGELQAARDLHMQSAEAEKKAGGPLIGVINSELQALGIDITQGKSRSALPEIELHLAQVDEWWHQSR
ncbi:CHAT domain-containing protein [Synechococcus sp. CS-1332]|uniref:CHAT domain-containing protein n=1 Tax=Synechococcus sp. CS-1332 TaxID=2847972 RepID=UPI00223AA7BE|nr:CHAT domain-containing protein [Synechococcus sp. CS-1332]MCT0208660.1 CHAT domain-containing protein [Synechococcus sp. CS-1332]